MTHARFAGRFEADVEVRMLAEGLPNAVALLTAHLSGDQLLYINALEQISSDAPAERRATGYALLALPPTWLIEHGSRTSQRASEVEAAAAGDLCAQLGTDELDEDLEECRSMGVALLGGTAPRVLAELQRQCGPTADSATASLLFDSACQWAIGVLLYIAEQTCEDPIRRLRREGMRPYLGAPDS